MVQDSLVGWQRRVFGGWFGIPEAECPPNLYRLLELRMFESDTSTIQRSLHQRRALVHAMGVDQDPSDVQAALTFFGLGRGVAAYA